MSGLRLKSFPINSSLSEKWYTRTEISSNYLVPLIREYFQTNHGLAATPRSKNLPFEQTTKKQDAQTPGYLEKSPLISIYTASTDSTKIIAPPPAGNKSIYTSVPTTP